jgi:hypothetical protein
MAFEVLTFSIWLVGIIVKGYFWSAVIPSIIEVYILMVVLSLYLVYKEKGTSGISYTLPPPYASRQVYPRCDEQVQVLTPVKH